MPKDGGYWSNSNTTYKRRLTKILKIIVELDC